MLEYKYSNIQEVESRHINNGHWPFFGCFMQQTPNAVMSLNRLINTHNFSTIIEFGTHDAGLSLLFAMYCLNSHIPCVSDNPNEPVLYKNNTHHKQPKSFYTFDNVVRDKNATHLLRELRANFLQRDILNNDETIQEIGNIIKQPGKTLLLCDNGNKIREVELYSKFLKVGDIIMSHDYAIDRERAKYNKENGIWPSCELILDDIKSSCELNKIRQIYTEEFDNSVWFCGVKYE
jgi:cephalosporin hydroxylase